MFNKCKWCGFINSNYSTIPTYEEILKMATGFICSYHDGFIHGIKWRLDIKKNSSESYLRGWQHGRNSIDGVLTNVDRDKDEEDEDELDD